MGATDLVFSFFTPIAVSLVIINIFNIGDWRSIILLVAAFVSSFYRAANTGLIQYLIGEKNGEE